MTTEPTLPKIATNPTAYQEHVKHRQSDLAALRRAKEYEAALLRAGALTTKRIDNKTILTTNHHSQ